MQLQCGRNTEAGWMDRQKYISLAISSDPQAGTAHMPSALGQTEFKRSAFFWPQIWASGEDQHPSQFWQFAKTSTGLDRKSEALIMAESVFFATGMVENGGRQTCCWGRRRQSKTAFSLLLKHMMQIFMHEAEMNSWVILLPCLKTYSCLKGELTTVPKFENVLMSEFCSIYMPLTKSSQLPAYHKSLLSLPSSSPLKPLQFSVQNTNAQVGYSVYESSACERCWMHSPGDPHPLQYSKGKKDTSWIAALSASLLWLTSFTELEETPTGVKGSFILYSPVVVLTAKIAI